ncbi:MAG: TIGR02996 domain-containing protein [Archangium sp.]|nr:TIGR02996 domain-containing protein [Archangium sp.]
MKFDDLAKLWERTKHPRVSALFDALPPPVPFSGDTDAWLVAARAAKPVDRGPLISTLFEGKLAEIQRKLEAIEKWRDPRLSAALERVIREVPWSSNTSRPMWTRVFALVKSSGDPRFVAVSKDAPQKWTIRSAQREHLLEQLTRAVEELPKTHVELTKAESDAIFADERDAHRDPKPSKTPPKKGPDFNAIYENPGDDAPRHVLADALLEAGDPRGEFLQLQLMPTRAPADEKKMKALLKAHGKQWLAPFGSMLGVDVAWRRGFPAEGLVKFRNQADADRFGSLAEWSTFERLDWSSPRTDELAPAAGFIGPAFRHLQHAHGVYVEHLVRSKTRFALKTVEGLVGGPDTVRALRDSGAVPKLSALLFSDPAFRPEWVDACREWPSLEEVGVMHIYPPSLLQVLARAERSSTVQRVRWGTALVFHRDAGGRLARLEMMLAHGSYQVGVQLSRLPDGAVTELVTPPGPPWTTGDLGRTLERLSKKSAGASPSLASAAERQLELPYLRRAHVDGDTLVLSATNAARLVDLKSLVVRQRFEEPEGQIAASAKDVLVCDGKSLSLRTEGQSRTVYTSKRMRLVLRTVDGTKACVEERAGVFRLIDLGSGAVLSELRGDSVAIDDSGSRVLVTSGARHELHDLRDGSNVAIDGGPMLPSFLPDGRLVRRADDVQVDGGLRLPCARGVLATVTSTRDGKLIAVVQPARTVMYDGETGAPLAELRGARTGAFGGVGTLYLVGDDEVTAHTR